MTSKQKNNFDIISQFMNSDMKEKKLEKTISEICVLDRQIYERDLNIGLFYENGKKFNRERREEYAKYGSKASYTAKKVTKKEHQLVFLF